MKCSLLRSLLILQSLLSTAASIVAADTVPPDRPPPLARAHSHNDYHHARPLLDALAHGFCSVEADIHLVQGQLLVAHDLDQTRPENTLQRLYLDPLLLRIKQFRGRVYPNGPPFFLLIDLKSEADSTYAKLRDILPHYSQMLTQFSANKVQTNAVTIFLSGNRPRTTLENETTRWVAMDGRMEDLNSNAPVHFIPLISDNWNRLFQWRGKGPFPPSEQEKLRRFVKQAHHQNRLVRFWGAPDVPATWEILLAAEVDLINTDHLQGLSEFLLSHPRMTP